MKNFLAFVLAIAIGVTLGAAIMGMQPHTQPDPFGYQAYRTLNHVSVPLCTLRDVPIQPGIVSRGITPRRAPVGIRCLETKTIPTGDQWNVWLGYQVWYSCYHDQYEDACGKLFN